MNNTIKIVITGAESTGKTTLASQLAANYGTIWIPEFARAFLEKKNSSYTFKDVEYIARNQIKAVNEAARKEKKVLFIDTYLVIIRMWFTYVYKRCPRWLDEEERKYPIDYYLLCDIDLEWQPDPLRENGGEMRAILHNEYIRYLKKNHFRFDIVSGNGEERFELAKYFLKTRIGL